ncbi:hypothetical protein [Cellulomonas septica]|uniref:Uncharacterized protein n=1 Tax=Cellulomonas septica TaxID=285080 RepID=A0ABX1K8G4_9CELL|nr:hypothetical protein [Cellulomonas septica]NKY41268.1 hypothetical protein [Cellulomonas septica]
MTTQTTQKKDNRKRVAAVALVGLGIAGLATASASQLSVAAQDRVASGVATEVDGLKGAVATLSTQRDGTTPPDAAGAVPVVLTIALSDVPAGVDLDDWTGTVYVGASDTVGIAFDPADLQPIAGGLTSHDELDTVSVVLVKNA